MQPKKLLISAAITLIILEILSIAVMESIKPWAILSHSSLLLKILGWYFTIQFGILLLAAWSIHTLVSVDALCPICHKNARDFSAVYGAPIKCRRCGTISHKLCLQSKNNRCPVCYPEEEGEIEHDYRKRMPSYDNS